MWQKLLQWNFEIFLSPTPKRLIPFFFPEFTPKNANRHQKKSESFARKITSQKENKNCKLRLTNIYQFLPGPCIKTLKFMTKSIWNWVTTTPELPHNTAAWIGCIWDLWQRYNVPHMNKCHKKDDQSTSGKKSFPLQKIARLLQKNFFCIFKNIRFILCDFKRKLCCWFFYFWISHAN